jgi:hypothetical protein
MRSPCRLSASFWLVAVVILALLVVPSSACRAKTAAARAEASQSPATVTWLLKHGDNETLSTSVSGRESFTCTAAQETEQPTERPCRRFSVFASRRGTLVVRLQWDDDHPLLMAAATADGVPITATCCRSPQQLRVVAQPDSTYELQVMLMTPWGHGEHQPFQLTASWEF